MLPRQSTRQHFGFHKPAFFNLSPNQILQAVCGEIMNHLMHTKLSIGHIHNLLWKSGIHGICFHIGYKVPDMIEEVVHRRTHCNFQQVIRSENIAKRLKILIQRDSFTKQFIGQRFRISRKVGHHAQFAQKKLVKFHFHSASLLIGLSGRLSDNQHPHS